MKRFSILLSYFLLAFAVPSLAATNENQIRIIFNNGVTTPDLFCDAADTVELLKAITRRRFLRVTDVAPDTSHERNLQVTYYPASCKTACAGFAPGTCLAQGCKGYARALQKAEETTDAVLEEEDDKDRILKSEWCTLATKHADNYLDAIIKAKKVSSPCIELLQTTRQMECLIVTC